MSGKKKTAAKVDLGSARIHSKNDREMDFLFEKFMELHPEEVSENGCIDPDRVVDWAFESKIFQPKPVNHRTRLRRRVSRHLGHRYMIDPQGREVRALLAVPMTEVTEEGATKKYGYFPLFQTEPEKVEAGLKLRLNWAFTRVKQIDTDKESYDDNNIFGRKLGQLDLDFQKRLDESKMPTEWPDTPPEDDDSDDDR